MDPRPDRSAGDEEGRQQQQKEGEETGSEDSPPTEVAPAVHVVSFGELTPSSRLFGPAATTKGKSKAVATCLTCGRAFSSLARLSSHVRSQHPQQTPAPEIITSSIPVDIVPKSEPSETPSTSEEFACTNCNKRFGSRFKLARHALIHSDRRPFACSVCERSFHRKDHLKNHVKVHSPSKTVYACERPGCHKEYTSPASFRKHAALHAAQDGALECRVCGRAFNTQAEVLHHLKAHASGARGPGERKFRCDVCERRFFTRKDVRRHLVVHTGRRDFLCQFCPQRFGRKDHLVRHIKKSHPHDSAAQPYPVPSTSTQTSVKAEPWVTYPQPQSPLLQPPFAETPNPLYTSSTLLESDILGLVHLLPDEEAKPLPGFSQAFQQQPP